MCGIVGYIGNKQASDILLEGLRRLEYRGYDSAGLAILNLESPGQNAPAQACLNVVRCAGKISALQQLLSEKRLPGTCGIGHTRWATHGRPSENNAHPHVVNGVAVVHNGIIENYSELKKELIKSGRKFASETDTEVLSHLIDEELSAASPAPARPTISLFQAVVRALKKVEGTYAIVVISQHEPDYLVAAKNFSPLIIGLGQGENFIASDIPALLPYTNKIITLKENEIARVYCDRVEIYDLLTGELRTPQIITVNLSPLAAEKEGHKHFMHKEIFEIPTVFTNTFLGRLKRDERKICFEEASLDFSRLERIIIVACGTSYHAGLIGKYYIEQIAGIPTEVDFASEFRYRNPVLRPGDLAIVISQSGETADTLAALRTIKEKGLKNLAICNVMNSSIARTADEVIYTRAGLEIGVASTKAFIAQVEVLLLLSLALATKLGTLTPEDLNYFIDSLTRIPGLLEKQLAIEDKIKELAAQFVRARNFIYFGRGINYPVALEGALKLKEISYIHAEAYPAGEMKHGPIALIDEEMPVLAIATRGSQLKKIISNLLEAKARGGILLGLMTKGDEETRALVDYAIEVEDVDEYFQPFINTIPLQLFAYHVADLKGTDVDQPRNLAKSVTVE